MSRIPKDAPVRVQILSPEEPSTSSSPAAESERSPLPQSPTPPESPLANPIPPQRRRGRPPGSKNRVDSTSTLNALSQDPEEFEKQIRVAKIFVRSIVSGIDSIYRIAELEGLSSDEKDAGATAFAALIYQYGGMTNAWVLVGLWLASTTIPRVGQLIARIIKKRRSVSSEVKGQVALIQAKEKEAVQEAAAKLLEVSKTEVVTDAAS